MQTHNLNIYHCLSCGAVLHREPEQEVPQCCGRKMIKAAVETVLNQESGMSLPQSESAENDRTDSPGLPIKPR